MSTLPPRRPLYPPPVRPMSARALVMFWCALVLASVLVWVVLVASALAVVRP